MRDALQRFWLSALTEFVTAAENTSPKTPHGAYSFPLWLILVGVTVYLINHKINIL